MSIQTNLHGRLRNTSLPFAHGLLPLFEAVINSIHSIEEANLLADGGHITIEVLRKATNLELGLTNDSKRRGPSDLPPK